MRILALETSCDDTACAIVEDGRRVLASVVKSQDSVHAPFGGVIPELAARNHIQWVNPCVAETLATAKLELSEIDAFAATLGPGLVGSLLVGAGTAKALSFLTGRPFIGVNHLTAHICSNFLESDLEPPFLCLLVSGGHTQLVKVNTLDDIEIVGQTLDDAVGEAYDKVARLLDAGFPGGPAVDKLAQQGNPNAYSLPIAVTKHPYDFSFSGLKTAVMRLIEREAAACAEDSSALTLMKANVAASFQATVVRTLFLKTQRLMKESGLQTLSIAGGVSANTALRAVFQEWVDASPGIRLFVPNLGYCTDNAAMVASSAFFNPITHDARTEVFSRKLVI